MKSALATIGIAGLILPAIAAADPPACAGLLRQIYHYEGLIERAEAQGMDAWANDTRTHVDRMEDRLAARCPTYSARDEQQEAAAQFARLLKLAGDAALSFFTLGAM